MPGLLPVFAAQAWPGLSCSIRLGNSHSFTFFDRRNGPETHPPDAAPGDRPAGKPANRPKPSKKTSIRIRLSKRTNLSRVLRSMRPPSRVASAALEPFGGGGVYAGGLSGQAHHQKTFTCRVQNRSSTVHAHSEQTPFADPRAASHPPRQFQPRVQFPLRPPPPPPAGGVAGFWRSSAAFFASRSRLRCSASSSGFGARASSPAFAEFRRRR